MHGSPWWVPYFPLPLIYWYRLVTENVFCTSEPVNVVCECHAWVPLMGPVLSVAINLLISFSHRECVLHEWASECRVGQPLYGDGPSLLGIFFNFNFGVLQYFVLQLINWSHSPIKSETNLSIVSSILIQNKWILRKFLRYLILFQFFTKM